jgi:hypothetical protein
VAEVHAWLGRLSLVLGAATGVWLLALVVTRRVPGRWTVVLIGITSVVIGIVAVFGLLTALLSGPPHDALHWLYAALALVTLPVAAVVGATRPVRQQATVLFVGAMALVLFVVRLIQTGG